MRARYGQGGAGGDQRSMPNGVGRHGDGMVTGAARGALDALGLRPGTVTALKDDPSGNGSWLVDMPGGQRAVLRRYHPGASPGQIAYEHAVLRYLAAAGWAVPDPVSGPTCH